jgi:hypothetical protein
MEECAKGPRPFFNPSAMMVLTMCKETMNKKRKKAFFAQIHPRVIANFRGKIIRKCQKIRGLVSSYFVSTSLAFGLRG